ncbi:MAG: DUF1311 domain-containing protein [Rhodocyclaceae bacterium]|nr:DUF1311 domain-containing protein [Rhodocyclaceae bacterium]MBX3670164.1 DUF1311 domain-containing protein [Rhodocyclaceae bacterium]
MVGWRLRLAAGVASATLALLPLSTWAIDNPDAPDLAAAFEVRAKHYEARVAAAAGGGPELSVALAEYAKFLDQELNAAYAGAHARLGAAGKADLRAAQRRWLAWRDAEGAFIDGQWTQSTAGSSYLLTRALARAAPVRERTLSLLRYLRELPPAADK